MINLGQFVEHASLLTWHTQRRNEDISYIWLRLLFYSLGIGYILQWTAALHRWSKVKVDNSLAAFLQTTMGGKATVRKTLTQLLKWLMPYDESLYISNLSSLLLFDDGNYNNCSRYSLKLDTPIFSGPNSFTVKLFLLLHFKNALVQ